MQDLIRLFAGYNDGIINLLGMSFVAVVSSFLTHALNNVVDSSVLASLNYNKEGFVVGKLGTTPLATPILCIYDNNLHVTAVYVIVLREGEIQFSIVAYFY